MQIRIATSAALSTRPLRPLAQVPDAPSVGDCQPVTSTEKVGSDGVPRVRDRGPSHLSWASLEGADRNVDLHRPGDLDAIPGYEHFSTYRTR